ncbi:MAG: thioesterase family protein [Actinomycetota bacterium]|nr:thioesterase family protein [Actinomycetota bacterium]
MEAEALYVRDGDAYVGTILTQGGWDPDAANGGTVLALVGHCLDEVPTLVPMTLSRFTADLHRPVPIGKRLHVVPTVMREGKKIQVVQVQVLHDGVEHLRVSALRVRDQEIGAGLIESTTDVRPADVLEPPDSGRSLRELTPDHVPGFMRAVDMRRAPTTDGSSTGAWLRLEVPVVAGEAITPSARLAAIVDYGNLIGLDGHPAEVSLINPDVTAHILRHPTSEWIAITGESRFNTALGRGVSTATFSDDEGVFAFASTSQLIQPR